MAAVWRLPGTDLPSRAPGAEPHVSDVLSRYMSEAVLLVSADDTVVGYLGPPGGVLKQGDRRGTSVFEFVHPEDLPGLLELAARIRRSGDGREWVWTGRLRHARLGWQEYETVIVNRSEDPELRGLVVRTRLTPTAASASDDPGPIRVDLLESLADVTAAPIAVLDGYGRLLYGNRATQRLFGLSGDELRAVGLFGLATPGSRERLERAVADLLASPGRTLVEFVTDVLPPHRADEGHRILLANVEARAHEGRTTSLVVTIHDATSQRQRETALERLVVADHLTGLLNRAGLLTFIDRCLGGEPASVAVAYCDLDGFKTVNDTLGHEAGDDVLLAVAELLGDLVRDGDAVGRIGGDEFVVVLTGTGGDPAAAVERIRAEVNAHLAGLPLPVSISVGMAEARPGDDARALLRRADRAMYEIKPSRR